jgi:peptidoglycan hydrolase-like protein with peptidoglycan-binding domain
MGWLVLLISMMVAGIARAQDLRWVQIEAQPTLREAEERARAYAGAFPDVAGFALSSGWYAILLGPYSPEAATEALQNLRRERLIPGDSFIADGRNFRERYWPTGADALAPPSDPAPAEPPPAEPPLAEPLAETAPLVPAPPDQTPDEARAAEAALTKTEREEVQTALQWFGFYTAAIDGAFGSGTRNGMAAWQDANAAEATGILTTLQRQALLGDYRSAMAELGLEPLTEVEAGIEIILPLALVEFDRYEPPFVRYAERDGSGVSVLLISQPGDVAALGGLYTILQSLEIVPPGGERSLSDQSFEISGRNGSIESYSYAETRGGLVKGFTLVWPLADAARMARVLEAMKTSFRPFGDRALDPGLAPMAQSQRDGLLTGLEVRRPTLSRSGFFIDEGGTVLTTTDVLQSCARITVDGEQEMGVLLSDPASGLAVLSPDRPLAPPAFATFQTAPERQGAEVAVAGYPYEDKLTSPTLTFGFIEALEGLEGEPGVKRLTLPALAGDAGGPVVDGTGAVIGMLLPRATDAARQLPPDVSFAAAAAAIGQLLQAEGISLTEAKPQGALPPEDLTRRARGMTVLVSCWE